MASGTRKAALALVVLIAFIPTGALSWQSGDGDPPEPSVWDRLEQDMVELGIPVPDEATVQRFVELWSPRLHDEAWMNDYVNTPGVPPSIEQEGFHHLDELQEMDLILRLFEVMTRFDPVLRSALNQLSEAERQEALDEWRTLTLELIFDKDEFAGQWRDEPPPQQDDTHGAPGSTSGDGSLSPSLERSVSGLRAPLPLDISLAPPRARAVTGSSDPAADALDYRVCAESAALSLRCSPNTSLGVPVVMDVTGDGAADIAARLGPTVSARNPTGISLGFLVRRTPGGGALPVHVFALFELPQVPRRFAIGFDGRASTLAATSQATITVRSITESLNGTLGVGLDVEHSGLGGAYPSKSALTFGMSTLTYAPGAVATESDPIKASLALQPVPASFTADVTLTLGADADRKDVRLSYRASAAVGPLTAEMTRGADAATLYVSNLPSSVDVAIAAGRATSTASLTTSQSIAVVRASFRRASTGVFEGAIELRDIPTSVSLSFGRIQATDGSDGYTAPGLSYTANADTLDVDAFIEATLFGGDLRARARLGIVDLGRSVIVTLEGRTLRLVSTPPTPNLEIHVWAEYSVFKEFGGCKPSCGSRLRIEYGRHAGVVPLEVNDLTLQVADLADVRITLGVTSAIEGSYGLLRLGWDSITANTDIELFARLVADLSIVRVTVPLFSFTMHGQQPVNVKFHLATNHRGDWIHVNTRIRCSFRRSKRFHLHAGLKPHPHDRVWNGFTVSPPGPGEGDAWLVTPDPWDLLPDRLVDVIAYAKSPLGNDFAIRTRCH